MDSLRLLWFSIQGQQDAAGAPMAPAAWMAEPAGSHASLAAASLPRRSPRCPSLMQRQLAGFQEYGILHSRDFGSSATFLWSAPCKALRKQCPETVSAARSWPKIFGGLVFVPLSEPYLRSEWGEMFEERAPVCLAEPWLRNIRRFQDEEASWVCPVRSEMPFGTPSLNLLPPW